MTIARMCAFNDPDNCIVSRTETAWGWGSDLKSGLYLAGEGEGGNSNTVGVDDGGTIEGKGAMGKVTVWRPMRERERAGQ